MSDLDQRIEVVDGYRKVLLAASEQERYADLEHIKGQIDSFDDDRENMTELCKDIDKLEVERASLRKIFDELKLKRKELSDLEVRFKELNEPLQYSESKQKKLFEKCLGLQFKLTEDHAISLVFTNVNPQNLEQKYVITLDIDDQKQWKVVHMDPVLHGVRSLINDLNETSNFGYFCKHIRQKFQEICTQPTTANEQQQPANS